MFPLLFFFRVFFSLAMLAILMAIDFLLELWTRAIQWEK